MGEKTLIHFVYASLIILGLGAFTSVSLSALSHILIVPPAVFYFYKSFKGEQLKVSKSQWMLWGLVVTIVVSVIFNWSDYERPLKALGKIKYFLLPLLSLPALKHLFLNLTDKKKKILINLFLGVTTLASLAGLIALATGFNYLKMKTACHPTRACGVYGMYMTYGYGIGLFSILLVGMLLHFKRLKGLVNRHFLIIAFLINFIGLALSYSRGAWIGFAVAIPFYFFKTKKALFIKGFGVICLCSLLVFAASKKVRETFLSPSRLYSNSQRIDLWKTSLYAFKDNPIIGIGYRNFEPNVLKIKKENNISSSFAGHAHNNFLEHLASTGLLGFVFVTLFHLFWLKEMYRRSDVIGDVIFPFIIGFIVSGQFQYTFGDGENLFFIMGIYALSQIRLPRKALFLDRDGVLIEDTGYPHKVTDFKMMPNILPVLKEAREKDYLLIIITNQAGIAKGKFKLEDYHLFTKHMKSEFYKQGIIFDAIYFCPFHKDGVVPHYSIDSELRKPRPGMVNKACKDFEIDLEGSVMIGDKETDRFDGLSQISYYINELPESLA